MLLGRLVRRASYSRLSQSGRPGIAFAAAAQTAQQPALQPATIAPHMISPLMSAPHSRSPLSGSRPRLGYHPALYRMSATKAFQRQRTQTKGSARHLQQSRSTQRPLWLAAEFPQQQEPILGVRPDTAMVTAWGRAIAVSLLPAHPPLISCYLLCGFPS